ncbi:MAG: FAD-binding oxidoreductase [Planctomycetes bacterium]|nr:FAD-binding oxidoreductase [Planctomycetota bacterium]
MNAPEVRAKDTWNVAVIGGGIAGASALYHLTRLGARDVVLFEREAQAGTHASGRNAALLHQNLSDPVERVLARRSAAFYRNPRDFTLDLRITGSLFLHGAEHVPALEYDEDPLPLQILSPREARTLVPLLQPRTFHHAVHCPSDGVLDIHGLLDGFLHAATHRGADVQLQTAVRSIEPLVDGGFLVRTSRGDHRAQRVIDASGAWASELSRACGHALTLHPRRRHLFVTTPLAAVDPTWPFVWDMGNGFYLRPESGGLLFCACDEEERPPGQANVDPAVEELAMRKIARCLPDLLDSSLRFRWAGLRTFAPDGRFVLGEDPDRPGYVYAVGLGGHGITTAYEVGRLAADVALDRITSEDRALIEPISPARLRATSRS